jgi:glycosyltransferase involved in cell wall biosynthesis
MQVASMSRVSVVISTHNRGRLLEQALRSAEEQRDSVEIEIIVVDDGSSDDTESIVRDRHPGALYLRQAHRGQPGSARNRGIAAARSELVAFLDDDDVFFPGKLAAQVDALESRRDAALAYCDGTFFADDPARPTGSLLDGLPRPCGDAFPDLLRGNFIFPSAAVVRRACLDGAPFDEGIALAQDYDLWLRLAARHPFVRVDGALVGIRRHPASMSCGRVAEMRAEALAILAKVERLHPELVRRHRAAFEEGMARNFAAIAVARLREHDLVAAAASAGRALNHALRLPLGGTPALLAWWRRRSARHPARPTAR